MKGRFNYNLFNTTNAKMKNSFSKLIMNGRLSSGLFHSQTTPSILTKKLHTKVYSDYEWQMLFPDPNPDNPTNSDSDKTFNSDIANILYEHDRELGESLAKYKQRSWDKFQAVLEPDCLYMGCDKTVIKDLMLYFGHIFQFATDSNGKIVEETFASMRRNPKAQTKELIEFKFRDDSPIRYRELFTSQYLSLQEEIEDYIFSMAIPGAPATETGRKYLGKIPLNQLRLSVDKLIDARIKVQQKQELKTYIPFGGKTKPLSLLETLPLELQIDCELDNVYSNTAKKAFLRGIGLLYLGEQFYPDSVFSFQRSLDLNAKEDFSWLCHYQIARIYQHWGHQAVAEKIKNNALENLTQLYDSNWFERNSQLTELIEVCEKFSSFSLDDDQNFQQILSNKAFKPHM